MGKPRLLLVAHALALSLASCTVAPTPYSPQRTTNSVTNVLTNVVYRSVFATAFGMAGLPPNLQNPNGIVVVPDQTTPASLWHLYISDSVNNQIVHYTYNGTNATYLNYANTPVMGAPQLMCTNAGGTLLFVMENNIRITIWGPLGTAAVPTNTFPYFYTFGGSLSGLGQLSSTIGGPYVSPNGTLYVADRGNNRFQSYTNLPSGGLNVVPNFFQVATLFSGTTVSAPWIVRGAADGSLLLVDSGANRILNTDGTFTLLRIFGNPTTTPNLFNSIGDLAVNSLGHMYLSDRNNHRVARLDASGNLLETIGGLGYAPDPGAFYLPLGVAVDSADRLYVVDQNNTRVCIFTNVLTTNITTNVSSLWYP